MEIAESSGLKMTWVLADSVIQDPLIQFEKLKSLGSIWGSWKTWRMCKTDNVVCHDRGEANTLLTRGFQKQCNFYIPESNFQNLGRPTGVKLYKGDFQHEVPNQNEIVTLHLAASQSDILLLLGFDLQERTEFADRMDRHRWTNYKNLIRALMAENDQRQWILVNHSGATDASFDKLSNLSYDQLDNIVC